MFDAAFERAAANHTATPDPEASWRKVERRLLKHQTNVKLSVRLLPLALVASFLCGGLLFGMPSITSAFRPVIQSMLNVQSDIVSMIFQKDSSPNSALTAPPAVNNTNEGESTIGSTLIEKEFSSWEEASGETVFPTITITAIAKEYELNGIILYFKNNHDKSNKAMLFYSSASAGSSFILTLQQLEDAHSITSSFNRTDGQYETVMIKEADGFLYESNDGRAALDYISGNVLISLAGTLTRTQILDIANHLY